MVTVLDMIKTQKSVAAYLDLANNQSRTRSGILLRVDLLRLEKPL